MKVLAASIQQAADTFLHAGYISAHPRALGTYAFPGGPPRVELDLAEARRLKGESLSATIAAADWQQVAGALCFFGALGAVVLVRRRLSGARRGLTTAAAVVLALLSLTLVGWKQTGPPAAAPWRGVARQSYADPAQATTALLHGLVADAVINHRSRRRIRSLARVRHSVALPLPASKLTRGMKYALRTYGLDGWGRPFHISGSWRKGYRIRSAGADGKLDTADDRQLRVRQAMGETWEATRHAFYLQKVGDRPAVLFRRHNGRLFRYRNRGGAMAATGSRAFDMLTLDEVPERSRKRLERLHTKLTLEAKHTPLGLVVFSRRN
jgi:hypothetical protein